MFTPAEELGLNGTSLAGRIRRAFYRIPDAHLAELMGAIHQEATRRHLIYLRDGEWDTIRVFPFPVTALADQLAYVNWVSLTIQNALKRLPGLYLQDPAVRGLIQLEPGEERWLRECWSPAHQENNPVFGRLDAVVDFHSPRWKDTLCFVEPNLSGIGGLHLVPTAEAILADLVLPILRAQDDALELDVGRDIRELLMQEAIDHLEAIGRPARNICFVEPKYAGCGPDEQEALARYFHDRYGTQVLHADPAELSLAAGEVWYDGEVVDLVYRDYPVSDLLELEQAGVDVGPLWTLFRQNRVMSSMTADLDQKTCWEILTDEAFTRRYFSPEERQVFRRHVLWTRLLADRCTLLPDRTEGDLLAYVGRHQERLVLKPNRAYGGQGVVIGPAVTAQEWQAAVEGALRENDGYVVQEVARIPVHEFPVLGAEGRVHVEPFYTVMGFAPSKYGLAVLGRSSQKQVVNVAQRGGMCAVMIASPLDRLVGPGHPGAKESL